MNYQKITKCDAANGDGIRVTLWVSGCPHKCHGCHNKQTWDPYSGIPFTFNTYKEMCDALDKPWIKGLTLSGGDPFFELNRRVLSIVVSCIKSKFPDKDIWCYTGFMLEDLWSISNYDKDAHILLDNIDILVDGRYREELKDVSYPWAGSSNQRVWAKVDGEWVQSKYDKEYRERLNAKGI